MIGSMSEFELFSEDELKEEIIRISKTLYERSLITALGGNISARIPGAREFWITPSQVFKGALKPDDLVKLNLDGDLVEGFLKPSIEWPMHAAVYKVRPDVNAVVHAHNPMVLGLTLAGKRIKTTITDEAVLLLRRIEEIEFKFPGTTQLAEAVAQAASRGARAIILKNHGVLALGTNLLEAEAIVELLEAIATIEFVCYTLGREPPEVPPEEIEVAKKYWGI
ncbi:MAG: class II aldolase/adducin family protein [Thaumarchaeota archaeon]|nr:class II aldolase/adducin family protein [Candidatus Wolframiiraptor allenii]